MLTGVRIICAVWLRANARRILVQEVLDSDIDSVLVVERVAERRRKQLLVRIRAVETGVGPRVDAAAGVLELRPVLVPQRRVPRSLEVVEGREHPVLVPL